MISLRETCQQYVARRLSEGWRIIEQKGFEVILRSPEGIIRPADLRNDIETLRPNAAGDEENLTYGTSGAGNHHLDVDEEVADGNTSRVMDPRLTYYRDLYNIADHSVGGGTINGITVYALCRSNAIPDHDNVKICVKSGGVVFESPEITAAYHLTNYTEYSYEWTSNPNNSHSWTWEEIDAAQIGIALRSSQSGSEEWTACTQVYVEIDYTPIVAPTVTTQAVDDIAPPTATAHGTIVDIGGENCDIRGFSWKQGLPPTAKDSIADRKTPHGYCYYDGYLYMSTRENPGRVIKIQEDDYSSQSVLIPQHNGTDANALDAIVAVADYIWTCDYDGWLYKINPATLTVIGAWQWCSSNIVSLCYDETYIYGCGTGGYVAKFKVSDSSYSDNPVIAGKIFHSLVEDGDYLYLNDTTDNVLHKVLKSNLTLVSTSDAFDYMCTDDLAQDATYVYMAYDWNDDDQGGIVRIAKSDMALTQYATFAGLGYSYGLYKINDGVADRLVYLDSLNNHIWIFTLGTPTVRKVIKLTDLYSAAPINEIAITADYLHLTHYVTSAPLHILKLDRDTVMQGNPGYEWTESDSYGVGAFNHLLTGLSPGWGYYVRAFAHNSGGYGYGDEVEFSTAVGIANKSANMGSKMMAGKLI